MTNAFASRSAMRLDMRSAVTVLALVAGLPLAGCGTTDRIVKTSAIPDDYRARHPIVVTDSDTSLDVLPSRGMGRLDSHTAKQIIAFAQQYHELGHGSITVLVPRGIGEPHQFVADVRAALEAGGASGHVVVSSYPVADPNLAAPVRLTFRGTKARVGDVCGQWPSDLGSGSSVDGWENKTYWNFGCATQQMIAAQTSDPRDLITPRGEEPSDTATRTRKIEQIRQGTDPAVTWTVKPGSIASVGGN